MKTTTSSLTGSKFYSPALNAAIFDGPIRIYFTQYQESSALRIYFRLQENLKELTERFKKEGISREKGIFIMMYPTVESFDICFDDQPLEGETLATDELEGNPVLGLRGPLMDYQVDYLFQRLEELFKDWIAANSSKVEATAF